MTSGVGPLPGVLHGVAEPVFRVLPKSILHDLRSPRSESSLLWNLIYPRAQPDVGLASLLRLTPLWGSAAREPLEDDRLTPYYWGYDQAGAELTDLRQVLDQVDGTGPQTQVDLFLMGRNHLITVECKQEAQFGRCSRYSTGRCPEVHVSAGELGPACRYWEHPEARFEALLRIGLRPVEDDGSLPCDRHYQLARTYLVGRTLANLLSLSFHLWVFLPRRNWPALEPAWLDFTERVRQEDDWRRMRVIAWEDLTGLPAR